MGPGFYAREAGLLPGRLFASSTGLLRVTNKKPFRSGYLQFDRLIAAASLDQHERKGPGMAELRSALDGSQPSAIGNDERRKRRNYRAGLVLVAGLFLTAQAAVSAPDAAAQGTRPCAAYSYCFYEHIDYQQHGGWQLQYKSTSFGDFNDPPSTPREKVRDTVSSIINNTNRTLCLYNNHWTGKRDILTVAPHQDYKNLAHVRLGSNNDWNDKADYWRVVSAGEGCPPK